MAHCSTVNTQYFDPSSYATDGHKLASPSSGVCIKMPCWILLCANKWEEKDDMWIYALSWGSWFDSPMSILVKELWVHMFLKIFGALYDNLHIIWMWEFLMTFNSQVFN